jgi:hypothetical protein
LDEVVGRLGFVEQEDMKVVLGMGGDDEEEAEGLDGVAVEDFELCPQE